MPILKAENFNKRPASNKRPSPSHFPPTPTETQISAHSLSLSHPQRIEKVLIRDFPEDGVFFRVFYRNLALLHLRVLLLPFIVLLQNKHTTLAENVENLIRAQPPISAHLK